jgi:hypothetical protein
MTKKSLKVVIEKKEKDIYILSVHGETNPNSVSPDSEIRRLEENSIQGHYLIERYHYLGGGMGGWDSYSEKVGVAHGRKELSSKIYQCAIEQGKKLARKKRAEFVDKTN